VGLGTVAQAPIIKIPTISKCQSRSFFIIMNE
jgi:hypothetical protein